MKILLTTLNAKYIHSNLALKYLYMSAIEYRRAIEVEEFTINNDDNFVYTEILRGDFDVVCFSCYIWNIEKIISLASNLKKARPGMKIYMGGPEVSHESIEFMRKHKFVDYIAVGEGEEIFRNFAEALLCRKSFEAVDGLIYREKGKIYVNPAAELQNFDDIPFPYGFSENLKDKMVYYESSRGCPFRCAYCLSSIEKHVRPLSTDRVKKEIDFFLLKKVKQVKFIDRTFNYDDGRACEIAEHILNNDNGVTNFHFEICGELVSDKFLKLLGKARNGLFQVEIGIQSLNPQALSSVNRSTQIKKLLANTKKIIELGNIHVHVDLIAGLPYEDYFSFIKSFNGVYELGADQFQLGFLKLLKGTKIRAEKERHEYMYREYAPYEVISNKYISAEGITRLKMVEHILDLYYNRGGFGKSLNYAAKRFTGNAFEFYEEMACFFYLKGYQNRSHKKEDLYRIFYRYAKWKDRSIPGVAEDMMELLAEDMKDNMAPEIVNRFIKKGWDI